MEATNYEYFVCKAFGFPDKMIDKQKDPAGLANATLMNEQELDKVKVGTAYSMQIFISNILEKKLNQMDDSEHDRIESFFSNVVQATDIETIDKLITGFNDTVIDMYYDKNNGRLILR